MPKRKPETAEVSTSNDALFLGRAHEFQSDKTPAGTLVISDHATLKVFYDPIRQRILRALYVPMSVTELGDELDESPNRLYYHVRLLEQHGLVVVAEERRAGSNIERLYGRAATRYEIAPALVDEGTRLAGPVVDDVMNRLLVRFEHLLAAPKKSSDAEKRELTQLVLTHTKRIAKDRVDELGRRLHELFQEYVGPDAPGDDDGVRYSTLGIVVPDTEDGPSR
jgi:DNA-binding transcriptional ArsR family regulator